MAYYRLAGNNKVLAALLMLVCVHCAPAMQEVKLRSRKSGLFVQVSENLTVSANGQPNQAIVFNMYLKNSKIILEIKNKPRMFLMLKTKDAVSPPVNITEIGHSYSLVVDYPDDANMTYWENAGGCYKDKVLSQTVATGEICSIAFAKDGNVIDPCHVIEQDCIAIK